MSKNHPVPTEPGTYRDGDGELWVLKEDGHWFDSLGETRPLHFNGFLSTIGPWTPNA